MWCWVSRAIALCDLSGGQRAPSIQEFDEPCVFMQDELASGYANAAPNYQVMPFLFVFSFCVLFFVSAFCLVIPCVPASTECNICIPHQLVQMIESCSHIRSPFWRLYQGRGASPKSAAIPWCPPPVLQRTEEHFSLNVVRGLLSPSTKTWLLRMVSARGSNRNAFSIRRQLL